MYWVLQDGIILEQGMTGSSNGKESVRHKESYKYCNTKEGYHSVPDNRPYCPECKTFDVLEQGYPHNHRHHCRRENVTYWIVQD